MSFVPHQGAPFPRPVTSRPTSTPPWVCALSPAPARVGCPCCRLSSLSDLRPPAVRCCEWVGTRTLHTKAAEPLPATLLRLKLAWLSAGMDHSSLVAPGDETEQDASALAFDPSSVLSRTSDDAAPEELDHTGPVPGAMLLGATHSALDVDDTHGDGDTFGSMLDASEANDSTASHAPTTGRPRRRSTIRNMHMVRQ